MRSKWRKEGQIGSTASEKIKTKGDEISKAMGTLNFHWLQPNDENL